MKLQNSLRAMHVAAGLPPLGLVPLPVSPVQVKLLVNADVLEGVGQPFSFRWISAEQLCRSAAVAECKLEVTRAS